MFDFWRRCTHVFLDDLHVSRHAVFANRERTVRSEQLSVQLMQILMLVRSTVEEPPAIVEATVVSWDARQSFRLAEDGEGVHAEAINGYVKPEFQCVLEDRLSGCQIVPLEVRLERIEDVQIVLAHMWVILPCTSIVLAFPIVGWIPGSIDMLWRSPEVPISIWAVF